MNRETVRAAIERYRIPLGLLALVVILRPLVSLPFMLGFGSIASTILIWMVFVAAFNLLFGYTGLLSFGHAMFLGFGMYAVAIGVSGHGPAPEIPFALAAAIGIGVAALVGYLLGRLTVRKGEIYFAFLTLAVAQAVYFVANRDPWGLTGGSNGISKGAQPTWVEAYRGQLQVVIAGFEIDWYWAVAAVFLVAMVALWQIVRSPFGRSLIAVRENEPLARAMGINTFRYKVYSFVFSAGFSALAGALLAVNNHGSSIERLAVQTSGDVVLMAVLGGTRFFFGPVAGVFIWEFLSDYLSSFGTLHLPFAEFAVLSVDLSGILSYWAFFLGAMFVVVVLLSPRDGLWGYVRTLADTVADRVREVVR